MTATFIRAVPWDLRRSDAARKLRRQTGGRIVWDARHDGYDTFQTALAFGRGIDAIHLEDDVVLTTGWREKVEDVIAAHAGEVCQFYSSGRDDDFTIGSRHDPGRAFLATCCFYLPRRLSGGLLEFSKTWSRVPVPDFDVMVRDFLRAEHEQYWMSIPSLVQHRRWPSMVNTKRSSGRISKTFVP